MSQRTPSEHMRRRKAYTRHTKVAAQLRWVTCEVCGKRTYWSRRAAKDAAKQGNRGSAYECEPGSGRWHLTTTDADSKVFFREQKAAREDGEEEPGLEWSWWDMTWTEGD